MSVLGFDLIISFFTKGIHNGRRIEEIVPLREGPGGYLALATCFPLLDFLRKNQKERKKALSVEYISVVDHHAGIADDGNRPPSRNYCRKFMLQFLDSNYFFFFFGRRIRARLLSLSSLSPLLRPNSVSALLKRFRIPGRIPSKPGVIRFSNV